jgi:hypothetical protein
MKQPTTIEPATDDVAKMMTLAIEQGEAGVAALERLVAMRERAEDRLAERQFEQALAQFQADCPPITKNRKGAHSADYATLDHIMQTIRPTLTEHGLSVTFDTEPDGDKLKVWAIVSRDGHSRRSSFTVAREKASNRMNATQADGSALTYGRRYALGLALGISVGDYQDDDDGAAAAPVTQEQAATLLSLAEEVGADMPRFMKWAGVETLAALPASRYEQAVRALERKR